MYNKDDWNCNETIERFHHIRTTNLTLLFWTIRKTAVVKVNNCELYADDGRLKLLKMCSTGEFLALCDWHDWNYSLPEFYSTYNEINEPKRYHVKPNSYVNVYPKHCHAHDKKKLLDFHAVITLCQCTKDKST